MKQQKIRPKRTEKTCTITWRISWANALGTPRSNNMDEISLNGRVCISVCACAPVYHTHIYVYIYIYVYSCVNAGQYNVVLRSHASSLSFLLSYLPRNINLQFLVWRSLQLLYLLWRRWPMRRRNQRSLRKYMALCKRWLRMSAVARVKMFIKVCLFPLVM